MRKELRDPWEAAEPGQQTGCDPESCSREMHSPTEGTAWVWDCPCALLGWYQVCSSLNIRLCIWYKTRRRQAESAIFSWFVPCWDIVIIFSINYFALNLWQRFNNACRSMHHCPAFSWFRYSTVWWFKTYNVFLLILLYMLSNFPSRLELW